MKNERAKSGKDTKPKPKTFPALDAAIKRIFAYRPKSKRRKLVESTR